MIRKKQESIMRYLLAFMLAACLTPLILGMIMGSTEPIVEEPMATTVTEETTTTEIVTTTTTTTTETTTTTTETSTTLSSYTTTSETTTTTTTTETSKLFAYDILNRIEVINILLDDKNYGRLIEKDPEKLTSEERLELYYYNSLALERKHLREYLDKQNK